MREVGEEEEKIQRGSGPLRGMMGTGSLLSSVPSSRGSARGPDLRATNWNVASWGSREVWPTLEGGGFVAHSPVSDWPGEESFPPPPVGVAQIAWQQSGWRSGTLGSREPQGKPP